MKLTPVERLLLSNQFQILAALHSEEAERYEELCEILDRGYDVVARNRYRVFGRHEQCLVPRPEVRGRFVE